MSETTDREIDVRSLFSTLAIVLQANKTNIPETLNILQKVSKISSKT